VIPVVLMILERVPTRLRGELSRWMIEPRAGVFVGTVSGMVRDKLWEMVCAGSEGGGCLMVHSSNTEQGFALRFFGVTSRLVEDFEGLGLVRIPGQPSPRTPRPPSEQQAS